jgi:aldose 1-epimerase
MSVSKKVYGKTNSGEVVTMYTLKNKNGMEASFLDYGAVLVKLLVPDAEGRLEDVVLGFENISEYEKNTIGLGAFIGRHANRIGGAKFVLNEKTYELEKNDGNNNLHGGSKGYHNKMYEVEILEEEDAESIEFSRLSPNMEQGFPGNLDISVTYTLTDDNELVIEYLAVSDKDTIVNLTNHSYFNLSGHKSGSIYDHKVMIKANQFTPTDDELIPTGEFVNVENTPMDFRTLKSVKADIEKDYKHLVQAGGYDHNYVVDILGDQVEKVAEIVDDKSGRIMEVYTDMPGLQFYTGNFLNKVKGKDGAVYDKGAGMCFETQYFPNSCNIKEFTSCVLKAGEEYDFATVYKFR